VGGLSLLVGGTAVAAVAGGAHSVFSSIALGVLALALAHTLLDEIRRQATRRSSGDWTVHDTVNALLLGFGAVVAFVTTSTGAAPLYIRVVAGVLGIGYAGACCRFTLLRRRTLIAARQDGPAPVVATDRPTAHP
jgi:hypothetical protein